ncbi:UDP-N-acetylmuramate dehydrogenase [Candidatus Bipolaricaulota bacterium]|nr:UDP-N-acetylmuramate dehydrogenase [Candidatus Bipolaricaulota bacterium]
MPTSIIEKTRSSFLQQDVNLSKYTTWNIGGPASYFCEPGTIAELKRGLNYADEMGLEWRVIGNGSNLLVADSGFDGLIVRVGPKFADHSVNGDVLDVKSGAPLYKLADVANDYRCSCFNFVTGIPGTIGGGVTMNAGAFGYEVSDFLTKVTYLSENGEVKEMDVLDDFFEYRNSPFLYSGEIVLRAEFRLDRSSHQPSMSEILSTRRSKMPYSLPSAGSIFKNPSKADKTAGEMLDIVGAKGMRVGDAVVSHQHANFILNDGHATAANVQNLIDILQERVYKEFGVTLVTEVEVI